MNFPVTMLGDIQYNEIDLDVTFNMVTFCGGSSGAVLYKHRKKMF